MNKLAIIRSKTNILLMHQLCWEVSAPSHISYNHEHREHHDQCHDEL
jgi:hypothetical protein